MIFNLARGSSVLCGMISLVVVSTGIQAVSAQPHGLNNLGGNLLAQSGSAYEDLQDQLELLVQEESWAEAIVIINRMMEAEPSRRAALMDYRDRLLALLRNQSEQEKTALEAEIREEELKEERSRNVDWGPWLAKLKQRVNSNWTPGQTGESRMVALSFDVDRDGNIVDLRITRTSGHPPSDNIAMTAVRKSAPFDPLPDDYSGNQISISYQFSVLTTKNR